MKKIPLTRGKFALVDDDVYEVIGKYKWSYHVAGYATRGLCSNKNGRQSQILMHREITGVKVVDEVDHINHDGLDNRRCNLRIVDRGRNNANRRNYPSKSGFRGVHRNMNSKKPRWVTMFRSKYVGSYDSPEEAAKAYNKAKVAFYGDGYILNNV